MKTSGIIISTILILGVASAPLQAQNFVGTGSGNTESDTGTWRLNLDEDTGEPTWTRMPARKESSGEKESSDTKAPEAYTVGVDDILEIGVLEPDELLRVVKVAPDGSVTFPYIGTVSVKGLTIAEIQEKIRLKLSDGYMKYPLVVVTLQESRSRRFFVYGEVIKPGTYPIAENMTVLRAISMAGGFTKFGSSSRVKILRPNTNTSGYQTVKVDIKSVMNGDSDADIPLNSGDIVVVSEGVF